MLQFKFLHKLGQRFHAFHGHGVVDAGANAANQAMTLQIHHARCGSFLDKGGVQLTDAPTLLAMVPLVLPKL